MGVFCSHVAHRHARMLIGLDVIAIVGVGVVAARFEVRVGTKDGWEMAKLFCMQFVLHADVLFLQRAVLYPAEHFRENGRHFPFNN